MICTKTGDYCKYADSKGECIGNSCKRGLKNRDSAKIDYNKTSEVTKDGSSNE